jgi:hypothetical protein
MMINKIPELIPRSVLKNSSAEHIYIIDNKHYDKKAVADLLETEPEIGFVYLYNKNNVEVNFHAFEESAFKQGCKQCECIVYSIPVDNESWELFIETKYVTNIENAFRESNGYPYSMVDQVIQTVEYFREKEIIDLDRVVNAIVSFPTLIQDFSASFFTGDQSIEDIMIKHKIRIRAKNSAEIKSHKKIKL